MHGCIGRARDDGWRWLGAVCPFYTDLDKRDSWGACVRATVSRASRPATAEGAVCGGAMNCLDGSRRALIATAAASGKVGTDHVCIPWHRLRGRLFG